MNETLHRHRRRGLVLAAAVVVAAVIPVSPAAAATSASVTVNATVSRAVIPAAGHGINSAVYDGNMNQAAVPGLLRDAGFRAIRYPGGSYGDIYHWQTHTADGGFVAPNTTFDQYMSTVRTVGAQPVVIANYGTGTAQEAADWVRSANITRGYGARMWEIGNEVYGNGHYGAQWEADNHADKGPRGYATNAVQYISAMKAVDPSIRVGVVLTTPGSWPDGIVGSGDSADWNNTVLSIVQGQADFVIVHWYPGASSAADSLTKVSQIPTMVGALRTLINRYAGSRAPSIGITVTEMNPSFQLDSATAALFATDSVLTWFENGAINTDWWNTHNGTSGGPGTNEDGTPDFHDEGLLSSAGTGEPALNTPFPPYFGLSMVGRAGAPGDALVQASSSTSLLAAHAVRTAAGGLNVVLVNKDIANSTTVSLSYTGFTPGSSVSAAQWQRGATSISTFTQSSANSITVPPYSVTVLRLGGGGGGTTGPLRNVAASRCLDVNGANQNNGTRVIIWDCHGATNQQWTTTAANELRVFGGKCLDALNHATTPGSPVGIWDCGGGTNQKWTLNSNGTITGQESRLCLAPTNNATTNGTAIVLATCTTATTQQWSRQ